MSIGLRLFLWLWSFVWTAGLPVILLYLWRRGKKDALYSGHLGERFGRYNARFTGAIWVHAVSLGEMRSAVPMIRAMLARGDRVVSTHFTPAGRREAQSVFAAEIAAGQMQSVWVPLETAWAFRGFFRAFRPKCGLVMEIEIWPRMVFAARRASVPLFMCNAQYPQKSMARDAGGLQLRHQVMRGFAGALVKSQLQADRFASIGLTNIKVTGELRFEQPIPSALLTAGQAARAWIRAADRRVITIASAIEGEDPVYLHAIAALRAEHKAQGLPAPLFVYVPRRPERFDEVAQTIADADLTVRRRSELFGETLNPADWGDAPALPDVILGDSLGEMYFYLAMADQVIVGGGFNPKGAHNIIEPLALKKPVLTGPHVGTIEYPFVEAKAAGVAQSVPDAKALAKALLQPPTNDPKQIDRFFTAHSGATKKTLAALDKALGG
ncbi:MAG: 3-deoxy-D-manno-octulosonic acid transferase [Rhodobacteraceae bacterium]|nr:3-deoxy-D-manno-octulosonic acid transferase [Paracoccaceae bacterium]